MDQGFKMEPLQLLVRYALAVTLIVVFVVGGHGVHILLGQQGVLDEEVLNVSGRQRMLSQRIVLLSQRYVESGDETYRALLADSLDTFSDSHGWIMEHAVLPRSVEERHYIGPDGANLDQRSRMFIELARGLLVDDVSTARALALTARLEGIALNTLLQDLNAAVGLFEDAANQRAAQLEQIQIAAVAATLLIVLLEVLLIFRPTHQAMTEMIRRLKFQAWHDALTGLENRVRFHERVTKMMTDQDDLQGRMFVLALDLDGFKQVNDTLGHPVGDQVLQFLARELNAMLAADDRLGDYVAARVGGDEFLACAWTKANVAEAVAVELGHRLIAALEDPVQVTLGNGRTDQCMVGVSVGYALGEHADGQIDVLLGNADIALYESKRRGKGVATAFDRQMRDDAERRHRLTNELKVGLKNFEFQAYFHPQVDLGSGQLVGVEALARWDHPRRGLVGPSEFIELAEESSLIDTLDGQIMLDAFGAFRQCRADGIDLRKLSVNASGLALRNPEFCDLVVRVSEAHDVLPSELTIEVLESVLIQESTDQAIETINRLAAAGFGIAIDDFGVGFSSLSQVSRLDVTAMKIDRSLTRQVGHRKMDKILSATAAMASGINATLLAEGIETEAQRDAMKALGVEIGQGFLWSKPMPIGQIKDWARARDAGGPKLVADG